MLRRFTMKKFTKVLTTAVAVSMIGASFAACSGKKSDKVDGKYSAEYDLTDMMMSEIGIELDTDEKLIVEYTLDLDDGNYEIAYSGEDLTEKLTDFFTSSDVKSAMIDYMGLSSYSSEELDTLAQMQGYDSFDAFYNENLTSSFSEIGEDDMNSEGTYEIDGDIISFTPNDDDDDGFDGEIDDGKIIIEVEELDADLEFEK